MSDEFNATLEDDSPYLVAKHLYNLFNQCIKGDFTEVERLREKAKTQNSFVASSCVAQGDDSDVDEDDINVSCYICQFNLISCYLILFYIGSIPEW